MIFIEYMHQQCTGGYIFRNWIYLHNMQTDQETHLTSASDSDQLNILRFIRSSQVALVVKNLPAKAGDIRDLGSIPGSGRPPGEGNGNPLQYSCLESHGQKSLVGYSSRDRKESHTTEVNEHTLAHNSVQWLNLVNCVSWLNSLCKVLVFMCDAEDWRPQGKLSGREDRYEVAESCGNWNLHRGTGIYVNSCLSSLHTANFPVCLKPAQEVGKLRGTRKLEQFQTGWCPTVVRQAKRWGIICMRCKSARLNHGKVKVKRLFLLFQLQRSLVGPLYQKQRKGNSETRSSNDTSQSHQHQYLQSTHGILLFSTLPKADHCPKWNLSSNT